MQSKLDNSIDYFWLLSNIVTPPERNPYVLPSDWKAFFDDIKIYFPNDLIKFQEVYGSGFLPQLDDMQIYSPFHIEKDSNWLSFAYRVGNAMNENYDKHSKTYKEEIFEYFPRKNGLLPIGVDNNGFILSYKIRDEDCHIVIHDSRTYFEIHKVGFCEFLYKILTKELKSVLYEVDLIDSVTDKNKRFVPL